MLHSHLHFPVLIIYPHLSPSKFLSGQLCPNAMAYLLPPGMLSCIGCGWCGRVGGRGVLLLLLFSNVCGGGGGLVEWNLLL